MSWTRYPCVLRNWPVGLVGPDPVVEFVGHGADNVCCVVWIDDTPTILQYPSEGYLGSHLFALSDGVNELVMQQTLVNGKRWWTGGGAVVYWAGEVFGYVYSTSLSAGFPPAEWYDDEDEWMGDEFYSGDVPSLFGGSHTFVGRGSLRTDDDAHTVTISAADIPRWVGESLLGVYSPEGGATGERVVGNPEWRVGLDSMIRSNDADSNGRYKYYFRGSTIQWHETPSAYVYGVYGSPDGWWEMAEPPEPGSSATLVFAYPPEADPVPDGDDIEIPWRRWTQGDGTNETAGVYVADFARMI